MVEHTEDRIDELRPPGAVDAGTVLVPTNAIYPASRRRRFDPDDTEEATFTALDRTVACNRLGRVWIA